MSATQSKADALREELAALRRRLAEAEARRVPEAVPLKPQIAAPVAGHSTAPFAPATRVQCATRVQAAVRGQQARQDPGRSLERARSISEGPAAAEERRRARERAREREARRNEDYDAEAARQPEAAAEPSPAEQKKQQERVTPLMGTALLVALLELFACTGAAVGLALGEQLLDHLGVAGPALALAEGALVPIQAEPAQAIEHRRLGFEGGAVPVRILDADDEPAAVVARVGPVVEGRSGAAEV